MTWFKQKAWIGNTGPRALSAGQYQLHRMIKMFETQNGLGVTRYLFTLREVCKDYAQELGLEELPAFFQSDGYARIV